MKTSEIRIRDPYVVTRKDERKYYLFASADANTWDGPAMGFDCYVSSDLSEWEGPFPVFRPDSDFWATKNFWAPEVHVYQGRFYMFASFKADGVCRGTQILVADSILGPYRLHGDGPVTPRDWECLDGTLYIDPEGTPWMVFCHEWVQIGDGTICAMQLSPDLRKAAGEPILLFAGSSAGWTRPVKRDNSPAWVTDGPFLISARSGSLLMLWSSAGENGYAMGLAVSPSGSLLGPWLQQEKPLYGSNGGHGMCFSDFSGKTYLALHSPNDSPKERPLFFPLIEDGDSLRLAGSGTP
jgi:beta-xylosidase